MGVVSAVGEESPDRVFDHAKQPREALHMVNLAWRQHKAERGSSRIGLCMELGCKDPSRSAELFGLLGPSFYDDRTMVRPDDSAVDHIGGRLSSRSFGQGFRHGTEYAGRDLPPVAPKDAVPFVIPGDQMPPPRLSGDPDHALEVAPVILRRTAAATELRWQKGTVQCPSLIPNTNPLAQCCLETSLASKVGAGVYPFCQPDPRAALPERLA